MTFSLIALAGSFVALSIIAVSLYLFIPKAFFFYQKWNANKKITDISTAIFSFFIAFACLSYICIKAVCLTLKIEDYLAMEYFPLILFLAFSLLLIYLAIPKTIICFQKWKSTRKVKWFSLSVLFGWISIYAMAVIYLIYFPSIL